MQNMFNIFRDKVRGIWPTARKCVNYLGGFNTHNYKTWSRLLKLDLTLNASHIQRQITTSHQLFTRYQNINFPKKIPTFRPVEITVETTVAVAVHVNAVATAAASTIHKKRFTQVITLIGTA